MRLAIIILMFLMPMRGYCQGLNNIWITGYQGGAANGYGETTIDWISGTAVMDSVQIPMDFRHTFASIADSLGNLLFYTNGYYIADASHDTMANGTGINPGAYANYVPDGFLLSQGALILPVPESDSLYYLIHNSADGYSASPPNSISYSLYLTVIDLSLNGGLGEVIVKNQVIISDSLNSGKIISCKHANGRDWWIICHRVNSDIFYKMLLTPNGIVSITTQSIGSVRTDDAGQLKFSPDGRFLAYYHYFDGLDIFDFDRCSGQLSNVVIDTTLPYIQGNVGLEFSPNSRFLYVSNILKIYQYDMNSANLLNSQIIVAEYDSFFDTLPILLTLFCSPMLAPDGKIYITTGNSTHYYHVIEDPDSLGLSCSFNQRGFIIPYWYFNTIPNHPNYFLGALDNSPCDTLTSLNEDKELVFLNVYPNPATNVINILIRPENATKQLCIYSSEGRLVEKIIISPWTQYIKLNIESFADGIYLLKYFGEEKQNHFTKFVKH